MFSKFLVSRCLLVAAAVTLLAASPCRAVVLTAEVYETPGLDGYYTYDITATVQDGHINTFGFNPGEGIQGPLYQRESNPFVGSGIYTSALDDTGFLVGQGEGISVANQESGSFLEGAFTFGAEGWREHRSLELVRIVTDSPDEVRLRADLIVGPAYNDGTFGNRWHDNYRTSFDVLLSDIAIGPAPELGDLPAPPPPPAPVTTTPQLPIAVDPAVKLDVAEEVAIEPVVTEIADAAIDLVLQTEGAATTFPSLHPSHRTIDIAEIMSKWRAPSGVSGLLTSLKNYPDVVYARDYAPAVATAFDLALAVDF